LVFFPYKLYCFKIWPSNIIKYYELLTQLFSTRASAHGPKNLFFGPMLRAQTGQSVVFKTPTKLQHPYCNTDSFEAIAIGKLDSVLERQNVSLFRDLEVGPIFTLRIGLPPNRSTKLVHTQCKIVHTQVYVPIFRLYKHRFYRGIVTLWG
jgi:hypothetical protein